MFLIKGDEYQFLSDHDQYPYLDAGEEVSEATLDTVSLDDILSFIDSRYEDENWHSEAGLAREIAGVLAKQHSPEEVKADMWALLDVLRPK